MNPHGEDLVGCYQFVLNHYIAVHNEQNRNCITLNIQLTDRVIISYEVFFERTIMALYLMITQHLRNKANQSEEEGSEANFFPEELYNPHRMHNYRQIQIE